jgi:putative ABC transport system permease protein
MLRSYLISAWRNLAGNRLHAGINIAGLALGLAAAILIGLYLQDEFSYDHWIPGYRQVYRVALQLQFGNLRQPPSAGAAAPAAAWLQQDFPQIAAAGRMQADDRVLRRGAESQRVEIYWADPELFDVLPLPALSGDPRRVLEQPDGLVLTRRMARRFFGRADPIGQTLDLDGTRPFRVGAVLEDLPTETHLDSEIFLSSRSAASSLPPASAPLPRNMAFDALTRTLTYVRLRPGSDPRALARALPAMILRHVQVPRGPNGAPIFPLPRMLLQPLTGIHFVPAGLHAMKPASSRTADYALGAVGALIVLIAVFNFVNLMTARAARRAVEVGVRKVAGAGRADLLCQFLGESLLAALLAGVVAVALTELLVPWLDALLSRQIAFTWWREPGTAGAIVALMLATGLLGGLYPALVLAGFRPTAVLRGGPLSPGSDTIVRKGLVVVQFAILVGLILTTIVLYRQLRFSTNGSLRFDADQVLAIRTDCRDALPNEIRALPGVRSAACTNVLFGVSGGVTSVIAAPHQLQSPYAMMIANVDSGLLELLGVKPLAGRFFSEAHPSDRAQPAPTGPEDSHPLIQLLGTGGAAVINETAARKLGFVSPQAAVGHIATVPGSGGGTRLPIIGVAPDMRLQGVRNEVLPTFFRLQHQYSYLLVKLAGRQIPETLTAIDGLWQKLGKGQAIDRSFLDSDIQALYLDVTREAQVLAACAALAIFIACLGLFGLAAFAAEQRTREIGVRKAMGAATGDILRLLLWQFSQPVLIANLVAWPVAGYLLSRWLRGFYYHVALSWWWFAAAGAAALAVALATVGAHAYAVARERPVKALRYE